MSGMVAMDDRTVVAIRKHIIPEDALAHIYERFYRVDKSHSREIGGTGLGLAITKNAVLMHRGSITVTSKEGEGSCFVVKIPLTYISA